ncbi:hypothetical protein VCV18_011834 [Metarhizium anisopliae]
MIAVQAINAFPEPLDATFLAPASKATETASAHRISPPVSQKKLTSAAAAKHVEMLFLMVLSSVSG